MKKKKSIIKWLRERFVFQFNNDWEQLNFKTKHNWISVTPIHIYFEYSYFGYECEFTLLGIGFYVRFNTEKSLKLFAKWDKKFKKEFPELYKK